MTTLSMLLWAWGVITVLFVALVLYRRAITSKESDWIPLTDDSKEDQAIKAQTVIEMKNRKLTIPIYAYANNHYAGHAPATVRLFWELWDKKK